MTFLRTLILILSLVLQEPAQVVAYTKQEIQKRMKYHGTLVAWQENNGKWFFYSTDGIRCKLFKEDEIK